MLSSARWSLALLIAALLAVLATGCGDSGSDSATALKIGVSEKGKVVAFDAPRSTGGGLVELRLTNEGKAPHGVQLVRFEGDHTADEALEVVESESDKTPEWVRAEGGIGAVEAGRVGIADLNLEAGNFVIVDAAALGGHPATAEMKVSDGSAGDLPSTDATVVAEEAGEDEYAWDVSGLKAGSNKVTFDSQGDQAIHLILAAPVKGKAPPLSQIEKEFAEENGPPPPYIDLEAIQSTAVLDGGKSQTTELDLRPGKYIFFCPLTDRDGGKPHDQEGLLSIETVIK